MGKIFGFDEAPDNIFEPPAIVRSAPSEAQSGWQSIISGKRQQVQRRAERANELIVIYARGGAKAAHAALTPEELEARARAEYVVGSPEKELTEAEALAILANPAHGIDIGERRRREENLRERPTAAQADAG